MFFYCCCVPEIYEKTCRSMVADLLPHVQLCDDPSQGEYRLEGRVTETEIKLFFTVGKREVVYQEETAGKPKEKLRLALLKVLTAEFQLPQRPWGSLLGIRPTKVVHRLWDQGLAQADIIGHLVHFYGLQQEKAELLVFVAAAQRRFLLTPSEAKKKVAVYVGIPFCPTRCLYCSFPAYSLRGREKLMAEFLGALQKEIAAVGCWLQRHGLEVETLYLGGGTPTSLQPEQLARLLVDLQQHFAGNLREFTVEAGRPDTIDREKLLLLQAANVSRISINPQTMNDKTLELIGRKHNARQIREAFYLAREIGFADINMDLIFGLPGEGVREIERTMEAMLAFQPESITCHTMALKRASRLREQKDRFPVTKEGVVTEMIALAQGYLAKLHLQPYYLYRQREILANLENVGYALPGRASIYNIQMMEERQTVIALGGGSVSKVVYPLDWKVRRLFNPKDPQTYVAHIAEIIKKKETFFQGWLTSKIE